MRGLEKKSNVLRGALLVAFAMVLGACDADSPTAPTQTPNPPVTTAATTGFAISVGLSPRTITLGEDTTVTVTISARRTDTNAPVPRGSTARLSTTNGALTNAAATETGTVVSITFDVNGQAQATLAAVAESAVIRAQIEQSTGEATLTVNEAPGVVPFTLFGVVPNFGPPAGGTEVTIEGTGFSLPTEVIFGGVPVSVQSVTSTTIRVRSPQVDLPSGTNQVVSISVSVNVGEEDFASGSLGNAFTYTRNQTPVIPKIISATPSSGPNEGGTRVTIFGEAFGSEVQVFFGDSSLTEAPLFEVSPTRIITETPPATGQNAGVRDQVVAIRVRDLRSGFEARLASAFQYGGEQMFITAIAPDEGIYFGGTLVTIFGGGFEAPVTVAFGGEGQQVVSVSGTEIVARSVGPIEIANCARPSGSVTVVNIETPGENASGPVFTYRPVEPRIGSIIPSAATVDADTGTVIGSNDATITGSGFDRQSFTPLVTIGGEEAGGVRITSLDSNPFYDGFGIGDEMGLDIPPFLGSFDTEDCTVGTLSGQRFTETRVDVVVRARDTGCSDTLTNGFTYFPDDTGCRTAPNADFSFVAPGPGDRTVTFSDASTGSPTAITWDWGDGSAQEAGVVGGSTAHTFPTDAGSFTVKLTAANANGSSTASKSVTTTDPP